MEEHAADQPDPHASEPEGTGESYWDRLARQLRQRIDGTPEIRGDRVAAAKRALQGGMLHLHGQDLAEKVLDEVLRDHDAGAS